MACYFQLTFVLLVVYSAIYSSLSFECSPGHREVLGMHAPSEGHIDILHQLPTSERFWTEYVRNEKPVLFRGMADKSPGKVLWSDDYLREKYGDLSVMVEAIELEDGEDVGSVGVWYDDSIQNFLDTYRTRNSYAISKLHETMAPEVAVPPFLADNLILSAHLWIGSGSARTILHRDADSTILCVFHGRKDWIFIHPKYEARIPMGVKETPYYDGYAMLNPDRVDLQRYSEFAGVPWSYANMTDGDCVFFPRSYWHQVRSYGSKNLAVSHHLSTFSYYASMDQEP